MKQLIIFITLLGLMACQSNTDVAPALATSEIAGTYQTNAFLDYRYLALPASQMPTVTLRATATNTLTLVWNQSLPKAGVQTLVGITLVQQPDQGIELMQAGQVIGSIKTNRVFTDSGMETQGKLLRLSTLNLTFSGYRP